jgi:hypothetical protein
VPGYRVALAASHLSSVVEQRFRKPQVWGSNPQDGSKFLGELQ